MNTPTLQQYQDLLQQVKTLQTQVKNLQSVFQNHRHKGSDGSKAIGLRDLNDFQGVYVANYFIKVNSTAQGITLASS